jgi:hypothetical protein
MKIILSIILFLSTATVFANDYMTKADPLPTCFAEYEKSLKAIAAKPHSGWAVESLDFIGTGKLAQSVIIDALAEDQEDLRSEMLASINNKDLIYFMIYWSAPSNKGSHVASVNKNTCKEVQSILYSTLE